MTASVGPESVNATTLGMPIVTVTSEGAVESSSNSVRFTVALSTAAVDAVTIAFRTLQGTAGDGDLFRSTTFNGNNGTVTIPAGALSATVLVRAQDDSIDEIDEDIVLELFNPVGAIFPNGTPTLRVSGAVLDNDGPGSNLAVFVSDPIVVEGAEGQRTAEFQVRLSRPADTAVVLAYRTVDGSASAGIDYVARSGNATIAPGGQVATVSVPVLGDGATEAAESFFLVVTPSQGSAIASAGAVGEAILLDDDAGPGTEISILPGSAATESISDSIRFTVTLSEPSVDAVTVAYRTLLAGTAVEDDLFGGSNPLAGTVTFAPGQTSADIFIRIEGDGIDERDEHILVELFNPTGGARFAGGVPTLAGLGVIRDNDGTGSNLAVIVSDPRLVEGADGEREAVFEVRLSRPAETAFAMPYSTRDGSATGGIDYLATSGTLSFVAGQDVAYVRVPILGDRIAEATEAFFLAVTPPANLSIATAGAVGTAYVLDDDTGAGPEISLFGDHALVEDDSANAMHFVVTLSEPSANAVTVAYRTLLAGTAVRSDLFGGTNPLSGTVTFAPGETSASIFIRRAGDSVDERDEHIVLELLNPRGATLPGGTPTLRATGIILDDDGPGSNLAFFVSDPVLVEGTGGRRNALVEIRLSRPAPTDFTANFTTVDGTAVAGSDYVATSGALSFVAGQESAFVRVPILGDASVEFMEVFSLVVTPPATLAIAAAGAAGEVTILDDDGSDTLPIVSITGSTYGEDSLFADFTVWLSGPSTAPVAVDYVTQPGNTTNDDFRTPFGATPNNGTLTAAPGLTVGTFGIAIRDDSVDERDEFVVFNLTNPGNAILAGGLPSVAAVGTLLDNDGPGLNIALIAPTQIVWESALATTRHDLLLQLSRPSETPLTFTVRATDGTARSGVDFQLLDNSVTFAPGQTVANVSLDILRDQGIEAQVETFTLDFTAAPGAAIGGTLPTMTVGILNGGVREVAVAVRDVREADGQAVLRFSLPVPSDTPISFDVVTAPAVAPGTSAPPVPTAPTDAAGSVPILGAGTQDFVSRSTTVTFAPGQTVMEVAIPIVNDTLGEGQEAFLVRLGNMSGGRFATGSIFETLMIRVFDDDNPLSPASPPIRSSGARLDGTPFADQIVGRDGRDTIFGGAGNDTLLGGQRNDVLIGGAGDDFLVGGDGNDAAVFAGRRSAYQVIRGGADANGVPTVLVVGPDGSDALSGIDLLVFDDRVEQVIERSTPDDLGFDSNFYLAQNPDVRAALGSFVTTQDVTRHFFNFGQDEGRSPNAFFDPDYYLTVNWDVEGAIEDGVFRSAFEHYVQFGWREGRDPSPWFDISAYLAANPDVAASGQEPLAHYLLGIASGRNLIATISEGFLFG